MHLLLKAPGRNLQTVDEQKQIALNPSLEESAVSTIQGHPPLDTSDYKNSFRASCLALLHTQQSWLRVSQRIPHSKQKRLGLRL